MTTPLLRLDEMRRLVNDRIRADAPHAKGHGRDKWLRWCREGVIPTWPDPSTGTRYCNPALVFEAIDRLGTEPDRRAS